MIGDLQNPVNDISEERFRGKRFAYYSTGEIEDYLTENPEKFGKTKGSELLVGCVLARCSEQINGDRPEIGFMIKGTFAKTAEASRPNLDSLIGGNLVDDQDFDILLQYDNSCSIIQITRLEEHRAGDDPNKALLELIEKKLLVQRDDYLQLVVLLDFPFDLKVKTIIQSIGTKSIPYKRIYVVAQVGIQPVRGKFSCMELYPEYLESVVRLNL